MYIYRQN